MSVSGEAVRFEMRKGGGSRPRHVEAVMTVNRAQSQHRQNKQDGWKALITINAEGKRRFGVWRSTIVAAVDSVLKKHAHDITEDEMRRIRDAAATWQARRTANLASCIVSQPRHRLSAKTSVAALTRPSEAHSQAHRRETGVHYVHQVYGLFGDDKPMSDMFETSRRMWSDVAASMGATYHLWSAAEVEALMKQRYPQHWEMYCDVRYPIMRCDIGRIAILHSYGGLYADLDTQPTRAWYAQANLAVQKVHLPRGKCCAASAARLSAKKTACSGGCTSVLDMEVIVASEGNAVLLDWLAYIRDQIACKPYDDKSSFYYNAKMRYVFNTTGPYSMRRVQCHNATECQVCGVQLL